MGAVRFALGAEADIVSGDELDDAVSGLHDAIKRHGYQREQEPIRRPISGSAIAAGSTTGDKLELIPAFPAQGRLWNILLLRGFDTTPHNTVGTESWDLYLGDPANPDVATCMDSVTGTPAKFTYSRKVFWQKPGESLFFLVFGATAGNQLIATGRIEEYIDWNVEPRGV